MPINFHTNGCQAAGMTRITCQKVLTRLNRLSSTDENASSICMLNRSTAIDGFNGCKGKLTVCSVKWPSFLLQTSTRILGRRKLGCYYNKFENCSTRKFVVICIEKKISGTFDFKMRRKAYDYEFASSPHVLNAAKRQSVPIKVS